jgi:hypothetical protein
VYKLGKELISEEETEIDVWSSSRQAAAARQREKKDDKREREDSWSRAGHREMRTDQ